MTRIVFLCFSEDWVDPKHAGDTEVKCRIVPPADLQVSELNATARKFVEEMNDAKPMPLREVKGQTRVHTEIYHEGSTNPVYAWIMQDDNYNLTNLFGRFADAETNYTHDNSRYRAVLFDYEYDNATVDEVMASIRAKNALLPDRVHLTSIEKGGHTAIKTIRQSELKPTKPIETTTKPAEQAKPPEQARTSQNKPEQARTN